MSVFLQQKFGLAGKVALVTGSSQGLGKAMAIALARAGADVIINGRDAGKLAPVVAEITALELGVKVHAIAADLGDRAGVHGLIDQAIGWQSQLDILVNNAGIIKRTPAADHTDADWDAVIDVNLNGLFYCNRLAARRMAGRGGVIVNLASIMGFSGGIFPNAAYQASKGAVVNLTRALALEWAAQNIRVNAVAPTFVRTPLTEPVFAHPERLAAIMAHTPLGRLPEPDDIAQAVLFLASDAAQAITGVTLPVDSGYLAR